MHDDLIARAKAWLAEDPDPETRDELAGLIDAGGHRRSSPPASPAPSSSAPPGCAVNSAPARCA